MRRVAASLGTGPASLYRYVTNRDELLDLMADEVASEYQLREPGDDWIAARHPGQALLHRVNPATGITEADYLTIGQWLHRVGPGVIPPDGP
jgi:AcrR family transcriptional regulator